MLVLVFKRLHHDAILGSKKTFTSSLNFCQEACCRRGWDGTPTKRQVSKRQVFKTSGFKTSGFKTSGLQIVRFTKRQVSKRLVSKRPIFQFYIFFKQKV